MARHRLTVSGFVLATVYLRVLMSFPLLLAARVDFGTASTGYHISITSHLNRRSALLGAPALRPRVAPVAGELSVTWAKAPQTLKPLAAACATNS